MHRVKKIKLIKQNLGSLCSQLPLPKGILCLHLARKPKLSLRPLDLSEFIHLVLTAITQGPLWAFVVEIVAWYGSTGHGKNQSDSTSPCSHPIGTPPFEVEAGKQLNSSENFGS